MSLGTLRHPGSPEGAVGQPRGPQDACLMRLVAAVTAGGPCVAEDVAGQASAVTAPERRLGAVCTQTQSFTYCHETGNCIDG